eukprot:COSAG04_NODE_2982_length_3320_cov_22.013350_1_plen_392_part_00
MEAAAAEPGEGAAVLRLDVGAEAEPGALATAKQETAERDRQQRLGLVPPPTLGGLARAVEWLEGGKARYAEHEYERGVVELGNAVTIVQLGLRRHADGDGAIHRAALAQACGGGGTASGVGPLGDGAQGGRGAARDPEEVGVLLDAFFWRAACHRGLGMVERAVQDIDRLLAWHRGGGGGGDASQDKSAELHAIRALCLFEGLEVGRATDDARRAVALSPDAPELQLLLRQLVAYSSTALGEGSAASQASVSLRYVRLRRHEVFHELGGEGYVLFEMGVRLPSLQQAALSGWSAAAASAEAEVTVYKRFSEVLDLHAACKAALKARPPPRVATLTFPRLGAHAAYNHILLNAGWRAARRPQVGGASVSASASAPPGRRCHRHRRGCWWARS